MTVGWWIGSLLGALTAAALAALHLRRRLVSVTVHGHSMYPTYTSGERIVVHRRRRVRVGRVVVVEQPEPGRGWAPEPVIGAAPAVAVRRWMIKRVAALPGDPLPSTPIPVADGVGVTVPPGHLIVFGDNQRASFDSRHIGPVPMERVLGVPLVNRPARSPDGVPVGRGLDPHGDVRGRSRAEVMVSSAETDTSSEASGSRFGNHAGTSHRRHRAVRNGSEAS
ncbi:S26 family signal peptidase [Micromonospora sp. WMMD964]|uniref:S26 family signal peptidase n=1 Tax=Micromonospora sp. WMMD964 TaxID=3016091 RepID=UPI00249A6A32|nr:S26 family signal peptidase [Micromonospora sp. WMMD964]WFF00122.1 S26 family signal peptidase [Micromonospora sp. WMMD964]